MRTGVPAVSFAADYTLARTPEADTLSFEQSLTLLLCSALFLYADHCDSQPLDLCMDLDDDHSSFDWQYTCVSGRRQPIVPSSPCISAIDEMVSAEMVISPGLLPLRVYSQAD